MASTFYTSYKACRHDAQALANQLNKTIALRKVKEYGAWGYVFNIMTNVNMDGADYMAEKVYPDTACRAGQET